MPAAALVLNWAAESLPQSVETRHESKHWASPGGSPSAGQPKLPVLTASGERYTLLDPGSTAFARWQTQARQWEPRSTLVLELLHKIENILDDRTLFQSNCAPAHRDGESTRNRSTQAGAQVPRIDQPGFLRVLRKCAIVGTLGGMVDEQYALDVFLKHYMRTGSHSIGAQPHISYDVYQHCLWQIGSHAANMDMQQLIPDADLLEVMSPPGSRGSTAHAAAETPRATEPTRTRATRLIGEDLSTIAWNSPRKMNVTRARTATIPSAKVAVPGPGMYVKHLFSPFPNESIFPGAHKSSGGTKGWTWGSAEQRQFMKNTLHELGVSPGPAAYGNNDLGMHRAQIGSRTGRLPVAARHAQFGTAERALSVAHATVAGMKGGVTCELLNGVPQIRKAMLRKGSRKHTFSDVGDVVPTDSQLQEARHFLEYMFQQELLRQKAPPSSLVRTATGETFMQTFSGQYEKYDHSAAGKMELEMPQPVKESCFLLRDVSKDNELFDKYCSATREGLEMHSFLQILHDLEILGVAPHRITQDIAERIFKRVGGRWAKHITARLLISCLRVVQEYIVFHTLSTIDVQIHADTPRSAGIPPSSSSSGGAVTFREGNMGWTENARESVPIDSSSPRDTSNKMWQSPKLRMNTATSRSLPHTATSTGTNVHLGPGAHGVPNKNKTIQRLRVGGWKQEKGWDMVTQDRPVPNIAVLWGSFCGGSYKTYLGSPRHAHCGVEIPWSSKLPKNPSATFGNTPRFANPPPHPS